MGKTAYAAARVLHEARTGQGWKPVGRKIGFTNRAIWPRYGVYEPIWGMVYDRTLIVAQDDRAHVALAELAHPRIEPEICFKLRAAPPRSRDPEAMLGAIEWVAHAIEIVQCRRADWKVTLEESTAENGLHARLVLGAPLAVAGMQGLAAALPALQVTLSRDGTEVERGAGASALDSPLLALAHLVEVLAAQPDAPALSAGEIVSTGTLTDAHPVQPGETWRTTFSGLPLAGLTITFT